ncbi:DUF5994 family protein [Streptomyces sp. NPDC090306]|uniref:DUF5994 family protein n=1 Tax=unclassified Streptomyces TaxID=2593676 RepID=UPI0036EC1EE9
MTSAPSPSSPSLPTPSAARLVLAAQPSHAHTARRIDGAWWPRSYDLESELPALVGELPHAWGQIGSIIVNGGPWTASPGRLLVANQVVRLRRSESPRGPHTVCLLAPGRGRWDLLVVPPTTTEEEARRLMAAAVEDPAVLVAADDLVDAVDLVDEDDLVDAALTDADDLHDAAADADPAGGERLPRQGGEPAAVTGSRSGA